MSRRDTLFVGSLPPDITEETLRKHFSEFGRVISTVIPRDRNTGRHKNYAFVQFSSEEEASHTYDCSEVSAPRIQDMLVTVSWAYGNKDKDRHSPVRHSKHSKSRSRSPKKHSDWWSKNKVEDLQRDKYNLQEDIVRLDKKVRDAKALNEELRAEIESYKSQTKIFLPCGHTKNIQAKEKNVLDDLYGEALSILKPAERTNEILIRQLKSRIFYILENKQPELYRCKEITKVVKDPCRHEVEMECWQVRDFKKNSTQCREMVDKSFACGHTDRVICSAESVMCKQCYTFS